MLHCCFRLAVLLCVLLTAGVAYAEGFALYEYGARGMALGGAMAARKPDASAVAFNGALLTRLSGIHAMAGITAVRPSGKMKWREADGTRGTTELRDSLWGIPHAYYTHQISDNWFFGIGEFTRFGLGFEYPHDWPGRYNIYQVSLVSGSLNPTIAWKATDKLSLAAGVELVYVNLDLKKRIRQPLPGTGGMAAMEVDSSIKNADDWGVGFNLAGHYQLNDQWAVGLQYRSQVRVHAYGDAEFTYLGLSGPLAGNPVVNQQALAGYRSNFKDGKANATVILPDSFAGGVCWTPIPELSIEVGAVWTRWSTFKSLNINLPEPLPKSHNKKHWKDVWRLNAGVEYQALDWLALRAGYVWDQSPMESTYEDYLVPTGDRQIFSGGLGFKWEAWTLDLAYAYILPKARSYRNEQYSGGTWTVEGRTKSSNTQLFSVSLGYEF